MMHFSEIISKVSINNCVPKTKFERVILEVNFQVNQKA